MIDQFYEQLSAVDEFTEITNLDHYHDLPATWYAFVADVVNASAIIAAGRYKEIHFISAAAIVAVLNVAREMDIPFVFNGDGAVLMVPPEIVEPTKQALTAIQALAEVEYQFQLRIGMMPIGELYDRNYILKIAKFAIAPGYNQAMFSGDGLAHIENLIRDQVMGKPYLLHHTSIHDTTNVHHSVNLDGLECRWQPIPSVQGETLALVVRAKGSLSERSAMYRTILHDISTIYGSDEKHHPVPLSSLHLSFSFRTLWVEAKLRGGQGRWNKLKYLLRIWLLNFVGAYFIKTKQKTTGTDWAVYPQLLQATTDYKKYDETLRMVLSGNTNQREHFESLLQDHYNQGQLAYGIHVASHALMTCIVFERMGRQIHFVDAADGGFSLAVADLKRRLR